MEELEGDVDLIVKNKISLSESNLNYMKQLGFIMSETKVTVSSIIVMCLIILTSCMNKADMQSKKDKNVVPISSPLANNRMEQGTSIESQVHHPLPSNLFVIPKEQSNQRLKSLVKEIYNKVHRFSKAAALKNLKEDKFLSQDKEIRVWVVDANMSIEGFVSSYKKEKWLAVEINTEDTEGNVIKRYLDEPKSGWNNWLKYLETHEIMFYQTTENIPNFDFDSEIFVIEMKTNQGYKSNIFSLSEINKKSDKSPFSICTKIKEEFGVNFYC